MSHHPVAGIALGMMILVTGVVGCSGGDGKAAPSTTQTENSRPSGATQSGSGNNPAGTPAVGGNVPGGGG